MKLDLTDQTMKEIVSEAILRAVDEKTRAELIRDAVVYLLAPDVRTGYRETPIQQAFHSAIRAVAFDTVKETIGKDSEVKAKVKQLLDEAWEKVLRNRDGYTDKIAEAIASALSAGTY